MDILKANSHEWDTQEGVEGIGGPPGFEPHEGEFLNARKPRHLGGIAAYTMLSCFVGGAHMEPKNLLVPGQASLKNCPFSTERLNFSLPPLGS
jgi:hypothetical protein